MVEASPDLTVRGEPVERIYGNFVDERYIVNRRYQRKLVWTLDEKRAFIDSIINGYPVPIILLAESARREANTLEIIDGMQRLDAVVSFISNKYEVSGLYFDLNTIAVSKAQLDSKEIEQNQPVMPREQCVRIASYLMPLSIYEFADEEAVDTIFRRINSGGRQLSRQELRAAGSIGYFATVVRKISAKVRGDDSYSDILNLNQMQKISITNKELEYGIDVDNIFWVYEGVLSRDNLRQSRDEEIAADLIAFMVSDDPLSSRTEFLDDFYGMHPEGVSFDRYQKIEQAIQKRSPELVILDFQRTLDQIKLTLAAANLTFVQLVFEKPISPAPRYFQVIFLAFYNLVIRKNLQVVDRQKLVASMNGCGKHINIQEGGRWGAENRQMAVASAIGIIQNAFAEGTYDPAVIHWVTQFQNLLSQSFTEQASYDFKQGFLILDGSNTFYEKSFEKILKTCAAISNIARGRRGYVIVGVVESDATATKIEELYGVQNLIFDRYKISGIEHEALALSKNLDQFFQMIADKVSSSKLSEPLRSYVASNLKPIRYYDKTVYVFEVTGQAQPSLYDNKYYQRLGAQVKEVAPADFPHFFTRYNA